MTTAPLCANCGDTGRNPGSMHLDCTHCDEAKISARIGAAMKEAQQRIAALTAEKEVAEQRAFDLAEQLDIKTVAANSLINEAMAMGNAQAALSDELPPLSRPVSDELPPLSYPAAWQGAMPRTVSRHGQETVPNVRAFSVAKIAIAVALFVVLALLIYRSWS